MAVKPQQWAAEVERLRRERDALAQTMWEARAILGFDNDSAPTPHGYIDGMGWEGYRASFLEDMKRQRKDYDEALDEWPAEHLAMGEDDPDA